jgi:hypothetical protein
MMSELPAPHTWKGPDLTPNVNIDISHLINPFVAKVIEEAIGAYKADLRAKVEALDHAWDCDADKPRGARMPCTCPIKNVLGEIDGSSE